MNLNQIQIELEQELTQNILPFWAEKVFDPKRESFAGFVSFTGEANHDYPKASIINSRILWTFSAAYRKFNNPQYKVVADAAYKLLIQHFWDPINGGIYWMLDGNHQPLDTKKQIYAQAFAVYALAEYDQAFGNEQAKQLAISTFLIIERYGFDPKFGGYVEALSADWGPVADQRLSEKDLDTKKSMNTHLHVLEAYTNLLRIWEDDDLKTKIGQLIEVFTDKIIDKDRNQFKLFFDEQWVSQSPIVSYGHDIEGSWLLFEAAEVLGNPRYIEQLKPIATNMARTAFEQGQDADGGLFYEGDADGPEDTHKHWWPQNEATIGALNAYQISNDKYFLEKFEASWNFQKEKFVDKKHGEWHAILKQSGIPLNLPKVDEWKCPYHNGRFCLEAILRIQKINHV